MPDGNATSRDERLDGVFVWVLAPALETSDPNLDYYYDFTQSIDEYTRVFSELGLPWKWQPVSMRDFAVIIDAIPRSTPPGMRPLVLNLCDGDEINGAPGISVIRGLERAGLVYTGADEYFFDVTTSKIPMKRAFDAHGVATPAWMAIDGPADCADGVIDRVGSPVIVKPAVSAGSMGIGIENVVDCDESLRRQVARMFEGYRGWQLTTGGILAEQYVRGPEYTALVVGSYDAPALARVHRPVERVFHRALPEDERFLSFDRLWSLYEHEAAMPDGGHFYEYHAPPEHVVEEIMRLSWEAFVATRGYGYARVDLRGDARTGRITVLEVNAQCGLSDDENYTSIGAILRLGGGRYEDLIRDVLLDGLRRGDRSSAVPARALAG